MKRAMSRRNSWSLALACIGAVLVSFNSSAADGAKQFAPCAACHGNKAEGNPTLNAPAIAGLDAAYVARQLRNFRSGQRGTHKADTLGAQMRAAVGILPDDAALA